MIMDKQKDKKPTLEFFPIEMNSPIGIPMVEAGEVHAGFPSPVQDAYMNQPIDLNKVLVDHPATTFIVRVTGDSMIDEGVDSGDLLVVDRSLYPSQRNLTICMVDGEFCVKRIVQKGNKVFLKSGNRKYPPIEIDPSIDFTVWGVVTWVIKKK